MKISSNIINYKSSVKEVLERIEIIKSSSKSLFVVNDNLQIQGTVTDGDIRRGFIAGHTIDDELEKFINKDFISIRNIDSPKIINEAKKKGIKLLPMVDEDNKIKKIYDLSKLKALLPVDAVIMAGGRGKRLRPLTDNIPKPLLPLGNKSIIEHNINRLISFGVENIYITVNYLANQIIETLGDGSSRGINIQYVKEDTPLGTAGALSLIKKFKHKYVILMNSDLFTDINFYDLYDELISKNADIAVSSIPYSIDIPFAVFKKRNSNIIDIQEKPQLNYYANAGIYLFNIKILEFIPENIKYDATDLISDVIKSGKKVIDSPITGYWIDIGRHEEYNKAKEIVKHITK